MHRACRLSVLLCWGPPRSADDKPFSFEAALQSHVAIGRMDAAAAAGLLGKLALDADADPDAPRLTERATAAPVYGGAGLPCAAGS